MQSIHLTIVDDPSNVRVYKGPGHYAATRAQTALRSLEQLFPPLSFEATSDRYLTSLRVTAKIDESVPTERFSIALAEALASTGTRLAPDPYRAGERR